MSLLARWDEITSTSPKKDKYTETAHGDSLVTKRVYGNDSSLMVATRTPGYHSYPHIHYCEQLNYCMDGEIWIFVDEEGYLLRKGDFHRVPYGALHWAWNRSDAPCTLIESHCPQMTFEPERQKYLVGLFAEGEEPKISGTSKNIFLEEYVDHARRVEERLFGPESS